MDIISVTMESLWRSSALVLYFYSENIGNQINAIYFKGNLQCVCLCALSLNAFQRVIDRHGYEEGSKSNIKY